MPNWRKLLNEELQKHGGSDSCLTDVEILAIIQYTGPMVREVFQLSEYFSSISDKLGAVCALQHGPAQVARKGV